MSRIALLDATDGTATAVRAALGADAVVACRGGSIPSDISLVIAEVGGDGAFPPAARGLLGTGVPQLPETGAPWLLLVDRALPIDTSPFGDRQVAILQKPFDLLDLRRIVRALLDNPARPVSPSDPPPAASAAQNPYLSRDCKNPGQVRVSVGSSRWLGVPRVAADVATTLAAAARLDGAVWIVGEPGTGSDHVAAALAAVWDPDHEPVVWLESDTLASSVARLGDAGRVLWVPALDERPIREQLAFERYLALRPQRRVAVTSADNPETAVAAGTLLHSLHHALSRVSLRLAPLRERREYIVALATSIAGAIAARAFGAERVVLTDDARRTLESYPWPGNLTELEAVVTRSVIASGAQDSRIVELNARHLRFLPDHIRLAPDQLATQEFGVAAASPRRAVVVALGDMAAARAARPSEPTSADAAQTAETASVASPPQEQHSGVEAVLAAFAHDIRNPMSTIKTFAGLQAANAGADDSELARLAIEACERVDEHLDFLQRYTELTTAVATTGATTHTAAVDLVEILGEAVDAAGDPSPLSIVARRALWAHSDASIARFVADAVVAECRSRAASAAAGSSGRADVAAAVTAEADIAATSGDVAGGCGATIEIRIPVGGAAVDRLDKWVEGASLPWRLALAREAARRGGGDLQVDVEDGQMRLAWRLPLVEEGKHDDQAGSPDRRRRSRSS